MVLASLAVRRFAPHLLNLKWIERFNYFNSPCFDLSVAFNLSRLFLGDFRFRRYKLWFKGFPSLYGALRKCQGYLNLLLLVLAFDNHAAFDESEIFTDNF